MESKHANCQVCSYNMSEFIYMYKIIKSEFDSYFQ